MAEVKIEGINEMLLFLKMAESKAKRYIGRSIHPAAGYVMGIVKEEIQAIETDDTPFYMFPYRYGPTKRQKEWIMIGVGIAKLKDKRDGYDVKIGFDGYMLDVPSTLNKIGLQPIALVARSVNKGTSFMRSQPFMDRAVKRAEKGAIEIMDEEINKYLDREWDRYGLR